MIPKIKRILYATDLSENSAYAFRYAINTALQHDAKIYILYVVESDLMTLQIEEERIGSIYPEPELMEKLELHDIGTGKKTKKDSLNRLERFCKRALQGDTSLIRYVASVELIEGNPATQILINADKLCADLLITGTRGKGWFSHDFLGSMVVTVLRRARIPVLVIPPPCKKTPI